MCNTTTERNHADLALEKYVTETVMAIVKGFFSSPFSVNHSNLQVLFFKKTCDPSQDVLIQEMSDSKLAALQYEYLTEFLLHCTFAWDLHVSLQTSSYLRCFVLSALMSLIRNVSIRSMPFLRLSSAFSFLSLQTNQSVFIKLLQSAFRIYNCTWINPGQKANIESCIKTLADVGKCCYPAVCKCVFLL